MKPLEVCAHMSTKGSENKIFDWLRYWIAPNVPKCPYENDMFQLNNITEPPEYASYWPEGDYRGTLSFADELDEKFYTISFVQSVRNTKDIQEF